MNIAVSACLLGEKVRFDGGHKHDRFVTDELGKYASFVPFCPEAIAFGTPRPSIRLVNMEDGYNIISNKNGTNLTKELQDKSYQELHKIAGKNLSGIIFKSKSPSCGMGSAKAYLENGFADSKADGMFVAICKEKFPLLPMEEEGRLQDDWLRENFIMQLFAYDAIEKLKESKPDMKAVVDFHTKNKFLLQAKDEKLYRVLGNIVGNHENLTVETLFANYEYNFKVAIAKKSSIKRNRNVIEHMSGFFKNELSSEEKEILHEQIEEYAKKIVPIIVPLSTIKLYAKKHKTAYLLGQTFLEPYPKELALRSSLLSSK
ncbi:YbgA family protein [Sulfurimonas sp.]|uniref:YbgA family protein n=1 Tax=Sulfurimonas sp. TaxID=2022749 RepID=UPI003D110CBF